MQTWLGHKAANYLSSELKSTVQIDAIQLDFFKGGTIKGALIKDQQDDTLFYGQVVFNLSNFDYKKHTLFLNKVELNNGSVTIQKTKKDSAMNYDFLVNYFSTDTPKDTTTSAWDIHYGTISLRNVSLHSHPDDKRK